MDYLQLLDIRRHKLQAIGVIGLILGQLLCFFGITTLFTISLVYLLAVSLPYPKLFGSLLARLVVSFLLGFSLVQAASVIQFFLFPSSTFSILCLMTALLALGLVATFWRRTFAGYEALADKKDIGALLCAAFFVVPMLLLCFWHNDPLNLTAFGSIQGSDGASHYIGISQMAGTQHLPYGKTPYYPLGFHLATALVMDGFYIRQSDLSWVMNARVYFLMYIVWGAIVAYLAFYLARHIFNSLAVAQSRKVPNLLLACSIGPVLSAFFLMLLAREGFINFYYIIAAVLCALAFIYNFNYDDEYHDWWLVVYLLFAFAVAMSWGPLLVPALLLIPLLYVWSNRDSLGQLIARLKHRRYIWVFCAFAAQLLPLYLHVKYARLSEQQGINAQGAITAFPFGPVIAGLGLAIFWLCNQKMPETFRRFASNVFLPFYILIGVFAVIQYVMVGELRYYAIKTAYLLEIIVLTVTAAWLLYVALQAKLDTLRRWVVLPATIFMAFMLLAGITADPFEPVRPMLINLRDELTNAVPVNPDIAHFTELGLKGELAGSNNSVLHYEAAANKLYGNAYIQSWANLMQHTTDNTPEAGICSGVIFSTLAYGVGAPSEQDTLIPAVQDCIKEAFARHRPYYIVTDTGSVPHLREVFGDNVTYVY